MRVVAGKHRSRLLYSPKNSDVRPTTDMVKESIFNIIQNDVIGSKFLDLFALLFCFLLDFVLTLIMASLLFPLLLAF